MSEMSPRIADMAARRIQATSLAGQQNSSVHVGAGASLENTTLLPSHNSLIFIVWDAKVGGTQGDKNEQGSARYVAR
jgi:hypothetical protein